MKTRATLKDSNRFDRRLYLEEIERQRIKVETMQRGTFQSGVGWTYMNPLDLLVSAELSRQRERRTEIIRKGTWNPSRKGWEYNAILQASGAEGHHVVN